MWRGALEEVARDEESVRVAAPIVVGMAHCGNDEADLGECQRRIENIMRFGAPPVPCEIATSGSRDPAIALSRARVC